MSDPLRQKEKQEFRERLQALRDQGFEPYEIEALLTGCASQDMIDRAEARAHAKRKSEYEHEHRENLRKQR